MGGFKNAPVGDAFSADQANIFNFNKNQMNTQLGNSLSVLTNRNTHEENQALLEHLRNKLLVANRTVLQQIGRVADRAAGGEGVPVPVPDMVTPKITVAAAVGAAAAAVAAAVGVAGAAEAAATGVSNNNDVAVFNAAVDNVAGGGNAAGEA